MRFEDEYKRKHNTGRWTPKQIITNTKSSHMGSTVSGGGQKVLNKPSFEHFFFKDICPPPPFSFQLPLPNLRVTLSILIKATIQSLLFDFILQKWTYH